MKKILLVTTDFPYGAGEKTFIIPELEYLIKNFEVSILTCANNKTINDIKNQTKLPNSIKIYHYNNEHMGVLEKIKYSIRALFSPIFWNDELRVIKITGSLSDFFARTLFTLQYYSYSARMYKWIKKFFNREYFIDTVVYSFWDYIPVLAFSLLKQDYPEIKLVTRAHGFDLYNERTLGDRQPFRWMTDKMLNKIFFVSEVGRDYYIDNWCPKEVNNKKKYAEKYVLSRMGVSESRMAEASRDGIFRIVSCSSILPVKRIERIIDGLSRINGEVEWIHFGDGYLRNEIESYAKLKLSSHDNIKYIFKGYRCNDEIKDYYVNFPVDCFINTSESEGCPVSIQEAMAAGIPIIAPRIGEIPHMIDGNGVLIDNEKIDSESDLNKGNSIAEVINYIRNLSSDEIIMMKRRSQAISMDLFDRRKNYVKLCNSLMEID